MLVTLVYVDIARIFDTFRLAPLASDMIGTIVPTIAPHPTGKRRICRTVPLSCIFHISGINPAYFQSALKRKRLTTDCIVYNSILVPAGGAENVGSNARLGTALFQPA